jgi:hypothetical protein
MRVGILTTGRDLFSIPFVALSTPVINSPVTLESQSTNAFVSLARTTGGSYLFEIIGPAMLTRGYRQVKC